MYVCSYRCPFVWKYRSIFYRLDFSVEIVWFFAIGLIVFLAVVIAASARLSAVAIAGVRFHCILLCVCACVCVCVWVCSF